MIKNLIFDFRNPEISAHAVVAKTIPIIILIIRLKDFPKHGNTLG